MHGILARLAATFLVAAGLTVVAQAPAQAAACQQGTGVTVVVNGSVSCVSGGGGTAATKFGQAGHTLAGVPNQPGAVCRVNGFPAPGQPCFETNAYWGLFHANGTGGGWQYATVGAYSLSIPAGGWVAFVWQGSDNRTNPSMTPVGPAPAPQPAAPAPAAPAPAGEQPAPAAPGAPTAPSADPSEEPGDEPVEEGAADEPGAESTATPDTRDSQESDARTTATSATTDGDGGSPLGLVVALVAVAGLGGAAVVVHRRRAVEQA